MQPNKTAYQKSVAGIPAQTIYFTDCTMSVLKHKTLLKKTSFSWEKHSMKMFFLSTTISMSDGYNLFESLLFNELRSA